MGNNTVDQEFELKYLDNKLDTVADILDMVFDDRFMCVQHQRMGKRIRDLLFTSLKFSDHLVSEQEMMFHAREVGKMLYSVSREVFDEKILEEYRKS